MLVLRLRVPGCHQSSIAAEGCPEPFSSPLQGLLPNATHGVISERTVLPVGNALSGPSSLSISSTIFLFCKSGKRCFRNSRARALSHRGVLANFCRNVVNRNPFERQSQEKSPGQGRSISDILEIEQKKDFLILTGSGERSGTAPLHLRCCKKDNIETTPRAKQ